MYDKIYWLATYLGIEKLVNLIEAKEFDPDHTDSKRDVSGEQFQTAEYVK